MCKAQTTTNQVTDQINSQGVLTVRGGMSFASPQGSKTDRQECLLQVNNMMRDTGYLHTDHTGYTGLGAQELHNCYLQVTLILDRIPMTSHPRDFQGRLRKV